MVRSLVLSTTERKGQLLDAKFSRYNTLHVFGSFCVFKDAVVFIHIFFNYFSQLSLYECKSP